MGLPRAPREFPTSKAEGPVAWAVPSATAEGSLSHEHSPSRHGLCPLVLGCVLSPYTRAWHGGGVS